MIMANVIDTDRRRPVTMTTVREATVQLYQLLEVVRSSVQPYRGGIALCVVRDS